MSRDLTFASSRRSVSRLWGGLVALVYPILLIGLVLATGFRRSGDPTDIAASFLGAVLFLVAAPSAWVFAFDFIDVSRLTVLLLGTLTSLPLWYLAGAAIAERTESRLQWLRRYAGSAIAWTSAMLLTVGLLAAIVG